MVTVNSDYYAGPDHFWVHRPPDQRLSEGSPGKGHTASSCGARRRACWEQLNRVAAEHSIPVYSSGGFVSLTGTRGIAERALERLVPTILLHVGAFDPSGKSIFDSMAADAAAFVEADRVIETLRIELVRVALTQEQVEEHDLPTTPPKKVRAAKGLRAKWTVIDSYGATEAAEHHLAHLQDMHERNKRRR